MKIGEYDIQWGSDPVHLPCKIRMKLEMGEQNRPGGQFYFDCQKCHHILEKRRMDFISEPFKKELSAQKGNYNAEMEKRKRESGIKPDNSEEKGNYLSGYQDD